MRDGYSSLRAFARAHDVVLSAVQKAIKTGRVTDVLRNDRGFVVGIHAVNAWAEWLRNTDQGEGVKSGMLYPVASSSTHASTPLIEQAPPARLQNQAKAARSRPAQHRPADSPPAQSGADVGAGSGSPAFNESRAKRELYLAEQAELDYLKTIGTLVSAAEVERANGEIWNELKVNVFRMIPKKAAVLAAETDPGRIERLLTDALNQAFHESSRAFADAPAGGVEERASALS